MHMIVDIPWEHPQVSLLVDAMVEEELLQSTKDGYTDRTIFSLELNKRIELIIKKYTKVRKAIGILCFSRGSERLTQETSILLDLQDKFEGRFLKPVLTGRLISVSLFKIF